MGWLPYETGNPTVTTCGSKFLVEHSKLKIVTLEDIKTRSLARITLDKSEGNIAWTLIGERGDVRQKSEIRVRSRVGPPWAQVVLEDGKSFQSCAYDAVAMAEAIARQWIQDYRNAMGSCLFADLLDERLGPEARADVTLRNRWRSSLPEALTCQGTLPYWASATTLAKYVPTTLPENAAKLREIEIKYIGKCGPCAISLEQVKAIPLVWDETSPVGFFLEISLNSVNKKNIDKTCTCGHRCQLHAQYFRPPLLILHQRERLYLTVGEARYAALAMVYGNAEHFITLTLCPENKTWVLGDSDNPDWQESVAPVIPDAPYQFNYAMMALDKTLCSADWLIIPASKTESRVDDRRGLRSRIVYVD